MIEYVAWVSDNARMWYEEDERFRRMMEALVIRALQLQAGPDRQVRVSTLTKREHPGTGALDPATNERYRLVTWSAEVV